MRLYFASPRNTVRYVRLEMAATAFADQGMVEFGIPGERIEKGPEVSRGVERRGRGRHAGGSEEESEGKAETQNRRMMKMWTPNRRRSRPEEAPRPSPRSDDNPAAGDQPPASAEIESPAP